MENRGRGRPPTFTPEQRQQFAALVRMFGIRETIRITNRSISSATLGKIAHEFGIRLSVGRRQKMNPKESVEHSMSCAKDDISPPSERTPTAA